MTTVRANDLEFGLAPSSRMVVIEHANHFLQLERPGEVNDHRWHAGGRCCDEFRPGGASVPVTPPGGRTLLPGTRPHGGHHVIRTGRPDRFLRDGDRAFLTYATTGRGNEPVMGAFSLLDMTPYGRGETWEDNPEGWPEGHGPCWYWRSDSEGNATWGPTSRPVPQWTRPGTTPVQTLGRHGHD